MESPECFTDSGVVVKISRGILLSGLFVREAGGSRAGNWTFIVAGQQLVNMDHNGRSL